MVTITNEMTRHIIRQLLTDGGNHRKAVFEDINRQFIDYALSLFDLAKRSKLAWEESQGAGASGSEWYIEFMTRQSRHIDELQVIAGLPGKTVFNIYGKSNREVVLDAARENVATLLDHLQELMAVRSAEPVASIQIDRVVEFTAEETVLLINSLAVKRQQISGGNWSSVGMQVEAPLLRCLCSLYDVEERYHRGGVKKDNRYQVDYMLQRSGVEYRCEIKLNGRGNPESVTSAIARDPRMLLADYISAQNREKLDSSNIAWVDFSDTGGFRGFGKALAKYGIPHHVPDDLSKLDPILDSILPLP